MSLLSEIDIKQLNELHYRIYEAAEKCDCLEDVAQAYTSTLYNGLSESVSLARIFLTVPFGELPDANKQFVQNLLNTAKLSEKLNERTLVLSLVGTSGINPEWNDRKKSKGHIGIPLISADFINSIPMMSHLLKELGLGLDWIDSDDTKFVNKKISSFGGYFYVRDATSETDNKGRKIISAQNFVDEHKIKSVFSFGGGYLGRATFFTAIVFLRETIEQNVVNYFIPQASRFKSVTAQMIYRKKIFSQYNPF